MKFMRSSILCLVALHTAFAFKDLFKPHSDSKPSILDFLTKPKIPVINLQIGSHFGTGESSGTGSFGFGFGFGGQFLPSGTGGNLPPKETVGLKPEIPEVTLKEEKKKKVGPRPNWGEGEEDHPESYEDEKEDYPKPGSFGESKDYPKPGSIEEKEDLLPDWEDIGEKKSENLMNGDLVGDGLIQPRLNGKRNKRSIESRVFHVPLLFQSNAKPYRVKIRSNPNSLMKGNSEA